MSIFQRKWFEDDKGRMIKVLCPVGNEVVEQPRYIAICVVGPGQAVDAPIEAVTIEEAFDRFDAACDAKLALMNAKAKTEFDKAALEIGKVRAGSRVVLPGLQGRFHPKNRVNGGHA